MKRAAAVALAGLLAASGGAAALAQSQLGAPSGNGSQDNSVVAVPPAPAIVAAPPTPLAPPMPATPQPPGLVPVGPPPSAYDGSAANTDDGDNASAPPSAAGGAPPGGAPPGGAPPGQPAQDQSGNAADSNTANQPPAQDAIPAPPTAWQPGQTAKIGVLDKVDGGVAQVSIPVGGQSVVGDLQVSVLACMTRPPDQLPDAAAFLALQNTGNLSAPPAYRGWLIRSEPGAAVAGDASETFRIINCS